MRRPSRRCASSLTRAGGGRLDELRDRLMTIRLTESPDGIEEAEEAALALQQVIGAPRAGPGTSIAWALRRAGWSSRSAIRASRRLPRR